MIEQVKNVIQNNQDTLWKDSIGVVSLMVLLIAGLHLPGLI